MRNLEQLLNEDFQVILSRTYAGQYEAYMAILNDNDQVVEYRGVGPTVEAASNELFNSLIQKGVTHYPKAYAS